LISLWPQGHGLGHLGHIGDLLQMAHRLDHPFGLLGADERLP
jgi:hypothetical protein